MTVEFFRPRLVVENISNKKVSILGIIQISPGEIVDLYNVVNPVTTLFEDHIIKGLEKPWGDLYVESEIKRTIVIHEILLSSWNYALVRPENLSSINPPPVYGQMPVVIDADSFKWVEAILTVASPLDLTDNILSIPRADAITDGYLAKEDWIRFDASVKGDVRIWQYQDFAAPVGTSLTLTSFENGSGLVFDSNYIFDDTAAIVLVSNNTQPPTTTLAFPASILPGNRVEVTSHTGTTVILNQAPDASLNCRVYFLIRLPALVHLPNDYQEAPDFLKGAEENFLDQYYVNRNSDEDIYGQKTFNGNIIFNSGVKITVGAEDGYVLTSNATGDATWQDNTRAENVGNDGYGVFKQRIGHDLLQFKNVAIGSSNLTIEEFADNIIVDVEVDNLRVALSGIESEPTGFPNRTDSIISFDAGTRTLSVSPTSTSFEIYTSARRRVFFSTQSVVLPDEEGIFFVYFDNDGLLTYSRAFELNLLYKYAYVCVLYWDASNNKLVYIGEERHGIKMDGLTHAYLHNINGTVYVNGLGLNNLIVDGSGSNNLEARFGVDNGTIYDEDITISIVDGSPQDIAPYGVIPIFYRTGPDGYWRSKDGDDYNLIYSGTAGYVGAAGRPPYNEWTGSTWQLTEVTNNGFFFVHFVATNDIRYPIIGLQGISEYTNVNDARDNAAIELGTMSGLPFTEFCTIATVIFQTSNSYTNVPKVRIRSTDTGGDYVDWRERLDGHISGSADHGLLIGLGDDDHAQYILKTGDAIRNAITGKVDFSSGELRLPVSANPDIDYPSAVQGDIAFNSADGYVVFYNGSNWVQVGTGAGGGSGDLTGAANIGTDGYGFFAQKNGTILEFKNLVSATESLYLYEDGYNVYIGLNGNVPVNINLDGYFYKSNNETITGHTTFNPSVSTDPALTIVPDGYAPTTNVNDGSISIVGGIQYNYDGSRLKWLSNERKFLTAGRNSANVSNVYLEIDQSVTSSDTGYRILRNGTVTGIWAQTRDVASWVLEIRRNSVATPIISLTVSSDRGNHDATINVDINEGDEIQFYVNGSGISKPVVGIEIAWRI